MERVAKKMERVAKAMERVATILMRFGILKDTHPTQPELSRPELSRHAVVVAVVSCMFFITLDVMHALNEVNDVALWFVVVCLFGALIFFFHCGMVVRLFGALIFFFQRWIWFFSQPLIGEASYSNLYKWFVSWLFLTLWYHLLISQSEAMSVTVRMNLSFLLYIFALSIMCLFAFHSIYMGLECIFSRKNRMWPDVWTILQLSAVVSIHCCVFLNLCRERPLEQRYWKDKVCSSLLPTVEPAASSESSEISLGHSSWATFIALYIVNYVAESSSGINEGPEERKPDFLDMVPWYSCTSIDLYKTVFDLVVSVTVFVGRFDMRIQQATMNQNQPVASKEETQRDYLHDQFSKENELWFDFMADTGDGGNSTYTMARLLAQREIKIDLSQNEVYKISLGTLKRGDLLLIGGDLAYPNPTEFTYERRLFRPFQYALQPPLCHQLESTAVNKPAVPPVELELPKGKGKNKKYQIQTKSDGGPPLCFVIPGNHDWFDGLHTFTRNICHRSWLGGWYMPQKKSYFALNLPMKWWIFGLDLALHGDIDAYQFEFFSKLVEEKVGEKHSVIIMTHQPEWLVDWYENCDSKSNASEYQSEGKNVKNLIFNILKERCRLRIAGDIHHYMRHSILDKREAPLIPGLAQHLLVNGCGGAFAHPTHVFRDFKESHGVSYECRAAYPSFDQSRKLALRNILNFREKNWQFDFVGGFIYFMLVFSMFPQCKLDHIFDEDSISGFSRSFFGTVWNAFMYMVDFSYVSLGSAMLFLIVAVAFAPPKLPLMKRIMIGILHVFAHLTVALILMLVLEVVIQTFVRFKLVATSDYHSLYRWHQSMFHERPPVPIGIQDKIERWTFGLFRACIKYVMFAFDAPEVMAVTRDKICENGMESISRRVAAIYYVFTFLYFWVLSTPAVSLVFGSYLYICVRCFNLHYDEAFSSLRIADYKAFTRFHIKRNGDLEVFTLAVDKVPEAWELDPMWLHEERQSKAASHLKEYPSKWKAASHLREYPSKWKAADSDQEPLETVRIIDHFRIPPRYRPDEASGSATV